MSTISELTANVVAASSDVTKLLKDNKLPEPSFNETSSHDFDGIHKNKGIDAEALRSARNKLINAALDLAQVTMGPADYVCSLAWSPAKAANLGSLIRLDIPRRIPVGKTRPIKDIAADINLPEQVTARVIRYAVANGLLREASLGEIGHTAASARLALDRDLHNYGAMWTSDTSTMFSKVPEALHRQSTLGADKAPKAAAELAFPEYGGLFDYFAKDQGAAQRYSVYLAARAKVPLYTPEGIITVWDWESIGSETVVDVGGSAGSLSILLAQAFPNLKIVNQDIAPDAIKEGEELAKKLGDGLDSRITFKLHNFFEAQTQRAKVYILKHILHDWDDADCVKILKALVPVLDEGSHVLVGECLMPAPPSVRGSAWEHEAKRVEDTAMMAAHGAHERTLEQYQAVFSEADSRFQLASSKEDVEGSLFSVVDFVFGPK